MFKNYKIFKRKKTSTISSKVFKECVKCSKAFSYINKKKQSSRLYCSFKCTILSLVEPKYIKAKNKILNSISIIQNSAFTSLIKTSINKIYATTKVIISKFILFLLKSLLPFIKALILNSKQITIKYFLLAKRLLIATSKNIAFLTSAAFLGFIAITSITFNALDTNIRSTYHLCKNNFYYFLKWFKPRFSLFIKESRIYLKRESIALFKFIGKWTFLSVKTFFEVTLFIAKVCLHATLRVIFKISYLLFKPSAIFSYAFYYKGKDLSIFTYKYSIITARTAFDVFYIVVETLRKELLKSIVIASYYTLYIPYVSLKNIIALISFLSIKTLSGLIYGKPYVLRLTLLSTYYSLYTLFATAQSTYYITLASIKALAKASVLLTHLTLALASLLHDYLEKLFKRLILIPRAIAITATLCIIILTATVVNMDNIVNFKIRDLKDKFSFDHKRETRQEAVITKEEKIKQQLAKRLKDTNDINSINNKKTEKEQIEEYIDKHSVEVAYVPDNKLKKESLIEKIPKKPKKDIITQWSPPELYRTSTQEKELTITFDGGSNASDAKQVLRILRDKNIRTTFFLTGEFIKKFPKLTKVIASLGHEIGNHTMNHPHLTSFEDNYRQTTLATVDEAFLRGQLRETGKLFYELTGKKMSPIWRAPYGEVNKEISRWAYNEGYIHVNWTRDHGTRDNLDTLDWVSDEKSKLYLSKNEIKNKVMKFEKKKDGLKGGIVLMHLGTNRDENDKAVNILASMIDELREKGYKFTKVTHLMKKDKKYAMLLENFTKIALNENEKETILD